MDKKVVDENITYVGYYWLSDKAEPEILENEKFDNSLLEGKSFVMEGQLYSKEEKCSYSIKFVDGKSMVAKYEEIPAYDEIITETNYMDEKTQVILKKKYLSNNMDGRWLKFLEYWDLEGDEACEGMETYRPSKKVFVGFDVK